MVLVQYLYGAFAPQIAVQYVDQRGWLSNVHDEIYFDSIIHWCQPNWLTYWMNLGRAGCRNVRKGGDNVTTNRNGIYMCYVVFRSFKFKPT